MDVHHCIFLLPWYDISDSKEYEFYQLEEVTTALALDNKSIILFHTPDRLYACWKETSQEEMKSIQPRLRWPD